MFESCRAHLVMQRFEFRVVSVPDGTYTAMLNEYSAEGWELVTVAHDTRTVPARRESGLPTPPGLGRLGQAAQAVSKLGGGDDDDGPEPGSITTTLLWVFRRPLDDYDVD
ncbi:MAG TPA: hypothetical protein VFB17_06330 [Gaiellaceae bacterium]|nr:hypothetical protein [Gaiellaceae bacterium]